MLAIVLSWVGLAVLATRLWPLSRKEADEVFSFLEESPLVSIIIPARDEEKNLPALLTSIQKLTYPALEIIVVDDQSSDGTAQIAKSFHTRVVKGKPVPKNWNGKNWACHQGAREAKGTYLLFTDADTVHAPDSIRRAIGFMKSKKADLISALPYHQTPTRWEKLMGPFHALVCVATRPNAPTWRRLYAVGQYLLFSRESYERLGGHEAIAPQYPDDLCLANLCIEKNGMYAVHVGRPLLTVRLYDSFISTLTGWRRNFLAGIQQSRPIAVVEVTLAIFALTGAGQPFAGAATFVPAILAAFLILIRQRSFGNFSALGVFLLPFSLLLYCAITALAVADRLRGNRLHWKGRTYSEWVKPA